MYCNEISARVPCYSQNDFKARKDRGQVGEFYWVQLPNEVFFSSSRFLCHSCIDKPCPPKISNANTDILHPPWSATYLWRWGHGWFPKALCGKLYIITDLAALPGILYWLAMATTLPLIHPNIFRHFKFSSQEKELDCGFTLPITEWSVMKCWSVWSHTNQHRAQCGDNNQYMAYSQRETNKQYGVNNQ